MENLNNEEQGEEQISDEEREQIEREAKYWEAKVRSNSEGASESYKNTLNNLVFGGLTWFLEPDFNEKRRSIYNEATASIASIKKYFELLEEFPKFKEAELARGEGYFPELFKTIFDSKKLIDAYESELRK